MISGWIWYAPLPVRPTYFASSLYGSKDADGSREEPITERQRRDIGVQAVAESLERRGASRSLAGQCKSSCFKGTFLTWRAALGVYGLHRRLWVSP